MHTYFSFLDPPLEVLGVEEEVGADLTPGSSRTRLRRCAGPDPPLSSDLVFLVTTTYRGYPTLGVCPPLPSGPVPRNSWLVHDLREDSQE